MEMKFGAEEEMEAEGIDSVDMLANYMKKVRGEMLERYDVAGQDVPLDVEIAMACLMFSGFTEYCRRLEAEHSQPVLSPALQTALAVSASKGEKH